MLIYYGNYFIIFLSFYIIIYVSNSAPSDITLSANTVKENQPALTTVGSFSVTDQDTDDKHTFELTKDSDGSFVVIGSALTTAKELDYEFASEHEITVLVSDSDDSSFSKSFKVSKYWGCYHL